MNLILFFVLSLLSSHIVTFDWLIALVSFSQVDPPKTYYAKAIGKTGRAFRSALHDIIDVHHVIKYSSKNPDTADALANLDADPGNPNSVILIYSRRSEAIANFGTSGGWNREHLWCNSYGIDKRGPAYSDLHNLRPADASVNSSRSNKIFDTSDTRRRQVPEARPSGSQADKRRLRLVGTASRCAGRGCPCFVLYGCPLQRATKPNENDLQLTDDLSAISSDTVFFGSLDTLLEWHIAGPGRQR